MPELQSVLCARRLHQDHRSACLHAGRSYACPCPSGDHHEPVFSRTGHTASAPSSETSGSRSSRFNRVSGCPTARRHLLRARAKRSGLGHSGPTGREWMRSLVDPPRSSRSRSPSTRHFGSAGSWVPLRTANDRPLRYPLAARRRLRSFNPPLAPIRYGDVRGMRGYMRRRHALPAAQRRASWDGPLRRRRRKRRGTACGRRGCACG